jgi:hypothetical protein
MAEYYAAQGRTGEEPTPQVTSCTTATVNATSTVEGRHQLPALQKTTLKTKYGIGYKILKQMGKATSLGVSGGGIQQPLTLEANCGRHGLAYLGETDGAMAGRGSVNLTRGRGGRRGTHDRRQGPAADPVRAPLMVPGPTLFDERGTPPTRVWMTMGDPPEGLTERWTPTRMRG